MHDEGVMCFTLAETCRVNWSAWAALGGIASAVAAAGASIVAIRLSRKETIRADQREARDAIPLAAAIHGDLIEYRRTLVEIIDSLASGTVSASTFRQIISDKQHFPISTLNDSRNLLGCFPEDVVKKLARCTERARKVSYRIPEYYDADQDPIDLQVAIDALLISAVKAMQPVDDAIVAMQKYID